MTISSTTHRGTNGGGDQSLQFGDITYCTDNNDLLVGGTEDFNSLNRDRAFGQESEDVFLWAPGDGNDFFDGGSGLDVLFITLIGESKDANGEETEAPFFAVTPPSKACSQDFDGIYEASPGIPVIDVANGPGFCEIVERDTQNEAALEALNLDNLVRFVLHGPRAAFEAADTNVDPTTLDDGLRVSLHLKNVEFLVCAGKTAGTTRILDLRVVPAQEIDISSLPINAASLLSLNN
jgi:hypothetical protein